MDVLLDLWGVLLDSRKTEPAFRRRIAEILSKRHGGSEDAWRRAHDTGASWYSGHLGRPVAWTQGTWREVVARADAEQLVRMFNEVGVPAPEDPLAEARSLELEVMAQIDAAFPDARPAVARLKRAGHRLSVTTNATESNARGALQGARLLDAFDEIFTGERLDVGKTDALYWRRVQEELGFRSGEAIVVDDRLDYLEAAASAGIPALLLDRRREHSETSLPAFVQATLRYLAALPPWLELRPARQPL